MPLVDRIPSLALAFLLGSIPFGYLLAKIAGFGDVRNSGSGNIGATNVARLGGMKLGLLTLFLDGMKGWLPVFLALKIIPPDGPPAFAFLGWVILLAVVGHTFSPWLNFKGGKGVATACGALLALSLYKLMIVLLFFVIIFLARKIISLASVVAAITIPFVYVNIVMDPFGDIIPFVLLSLLIIINHRDNLHRITRKEEPEFTFKT